MCERQMDAVVSSMVLQIHFFLFSEKLGEEFKWCSKNKEMNETHSFLSLLIKYLL